MKVTVQYAHTLRGTPDAPGANHPQIQVGEYSVHIAETTKELAPVALITRDATAKEPASNVVGYRWHAKQLWTSAPTFASPGAFATKAQVTIYRIEPNLCSYWDHKYPRNENSRLSHTGLKIQNGLSESDVRKQIDTWAARSLIIDGVLHRVAREPRYVLQASGLESRGGSVWLVTTDWYNALVPADWYFSAIHLEEAIQKTRTVGATINQTFGACLVPNRLIDVYIAAAVCVNPTAQHAAGDVHVEDFEILAK